MARAASASGPRVVQRIPKGSREAMATLRLFRVIFGSVRLQFREVESDCGVSGAQLWMLHEIDGSPGIGVSALAARLAIHQTTCSQQLDALVDRGLVRKARLRSDQRRLGLSVTDKARAVLARAPGPAEGLLPAALAALDDRDLALLARQLQKVIDNLLRANPAAAGRPLGEL